MYLYGYDITRILFLLLTYANLKMIDRLSFKVTSHTCTILRDALERYVYLLTLDHNVTKKQRRIHGKRKRKRLCAPSGKSPDDNYHGVMKQLDVTLTQPCEEYPHLNMDEACKFLEWVWHTIGTTKDWKRLLVASILGLCSYLLSVKITWKKEKQKSPGNTSKNHIEIVPPCWTNEWLMFDERIVSIIIPWRRLK